jgi:hypothetical protein
MGLFSKADRAGTEVIDMMPRERRDMPWIIGIGIALCLIVILVVAWCAM